MSDPHIIGNVLQRFTDGVARKNEAIMLGEADVFFSDIGFTEWDPD